MPGAAMIMAMLLSACGGEKTDRTAGGVTPDEARALDEAAEMVEARRLPAEALRPPVATPSTGGAAAGAAAVEASPQASQGRTGETKR